MSGAASIVEAPRYILAPYVATPPEVVEQMLDLAGVTGGDVVFDLGCGDGRIAIAAAKRGARAYGCDIEPYWVEEARRLAAAAGVAHLATFAVTDALGVDVAEATVVALYLVEWSTRKLEPKLRTELRPGARIVSHSFGMAGAAERTERFRDATGDERTIRLWTVGDGGERSSAGIESTRESSRPLERGPGEPMEIADLTLERLQPFVGASFALALPEPWSLSFELAEASPLASMTVPPGAFRAPFRLIFHGPPSPVHPQAILPLEHPEIGRVEIFLVPIGPVVGGEARGAMQYEAIFT